ncbi:hypothetical protein ACW9UR_16305 [Halovulum sp. GXIMD14794]
MDETHPFRDREFEIQRLRRKEPCFASLWDDFEEVRTILKRLRAKSEPPRPIVEDYVRLSSEIRAEIEDWLTGPDARLVPFETLRG